MPQVAVLVAIEAKLADVDGTRDWSLVDGAPIWFAADYEVGNPPTVE
jgi:hypothetical protein